jgi:general stress protein YciG
MSNENDNQNIAPETASASSETTQESKPRRPRGFAAMDPKLVSELAKRGGKAAHRAGTAHQFTSEEARVAGRKGGQATHAKRRAKLGSGTSIAH